MKKLRENVDHALCKLPFEEEWLRERGVNATYVGHPYFDDQLNERGSTTRSSDVAARPPQGGLVALLPGSRTQEVRANFPSLLAAARKTRRRVPDGAVSRSRRSSPTHAEMIEQDDGARRPAQGTSGPRSSSDARPS